MNIQRTDRSARIMAAALSRRRALKGLAGAAALGVAGRTRRGAAATVTPPADMYLGMIFSTIFPLDLPNGDRLGVHSGITYIGLSGGIASGKVTEPLVASLGQFAERLIGGHTTVLVPHDGSQDAWVQTELWQFPTNQDAGSVRDVLATPGPGISTLPGGSDKGAFLASLSTAEGSVVDARYVVFSRGPVVGRITTGWRYDAGQTGPDPAASAAQLEELRKITGRRLDTVTDAGFAGLTTTIPTIAQLNAASDGRVQVPINHWIDIVTIVDGSPVRLIFQTEEEYERYLASHANARDAFTRIENVTTFGGNPLLVQVNATRFDRDAAAKEFFDRGEELAAEQAAANPGFSSQPIEPPPGATDVQETKWSAKRFAEGDAQRLGVSVSHQKDADYVGILVAGAPRPPAQNDNPAYQAALQNLAHLGSKTYVGWRAFAQLFLGDTDEEAEEFARECEAYDQATAALEDD